MAVFDATDECDIKYVDYGGYSRISSQCLKQIRSVNLYHSLGIFSRRQIDDIFLIFPRKQDITFHANCLLRRQFA